MKKTIIFGLALISLFLIAGCGETPTGGVVIDTNKELCNKPYIEFREGDCCLDANNNSFCDYDVEEAEKQAKIAEAKAKEEYAKEFGKYGNLIKK